MITFLAFVGGACLFVALVVAVVAIFLNGLKPGDVP